MPRKKTDESPELAEEAPERRCLTIGELARATKLSVSTLRRRVEDGSLIALQLGGPGHKILFPPDTVERLLSIPTRPAAPVAPETADRTHKSPGPTPRWKQRLESSS